MISASTKIISWRDVFKLYDTFGFPLELTKEIAAEKSFEVDIQWFEQEMKLQQERSRAWSKDMFKQGIDRAMHTQGIPQTIFVWYGALETQDIILLKDFEVESQRVLIFDKTPFYAESWGQVGDVWIITLDDGSEVNVVQVQKYNWIFLHFVW